MFPDPEAGTPEISPVWSLVQLYTVPGAPPAKTIADNGPPVQVPCDEGVAV
jgi:hypothetical protein